MQRHKRKPEAEVANEPPEESPGACSLEDLPGAVVVGSKTFECHGPQEAGEWVFYSAEGQELGRFLNREEAEAAEREHPTLGRLLNCRSSVRVH